MNDQKKSGAQAVQSQDFIRSVITELKRVTWPTQDEWVSATVLTIILVVGIGCFTYAADQLFGFVFNLVHPTLSVK